MLVVLVHGFREYSPELFGPITVGLWGGVRAGRMARQGSPCVLASVCLGSKEKEEGGGSSILFRDNSAVN